MKANAYIREVEVKFKTRPKTREKITISSSGAAVKLFRDLQKETQEKIICLHLDTRNTVTCFQVVFIGTSTQASSDPKAILRTALLANSNSIILIHNHPSGDPSPSADDIEAKMQLSTACAYLNLQLLDFIIIGEHGTYFSCADRGILKKEQKPCKT
ncbi:unnamed protein product [marine sediment metagenome]|uniref:MPN domain-containing protein n=1 Tax=marine sediment metagenome TaxID=412755 RepID=X1TE42_9ZZZZ